MRERTYTAREKVYDELDAERERQDRQWGGASHDDEHSIDDWRRLRLGFEGKAFRAQTYEEARAQVVKIAALAVAQLESLDRRAEETAPPPFVRCASGHRVYATRDETGQPYIPGKCPACVGREERRRDLAEGQGGQTKCDRRREEIRQSSQL